MRTQQRISDELRKRLGAAVTDATFHGLSRLGKLHPRSRPAAHGVEVLRDLAYGPGGAAHRFDVYRPVGLSPAELRARPLVLYVHGGGFRILSKDTHWVMGLAFARRGYVTALVNYRLAPRHPYPAALEDLALAWQALPTISREGGGDLGRLVLAGESAGANLVTSLAVMASFERSEPAARAVFDAGHAPRAVVAACGILQVTGADRFRRRKHIGAFLADRIEEVGEAYVGTRPHHEVPLADPLLVLKGDTPSSRPLPPFFASVGTHDPLLDDTRRLERALAARGVRCEARYYPREVHAFQALVFRPNARAAWAETFRFLDGTVGPAR
jgi:acetyl esterase